MSSSHDSDGGGLTGYLFVFQPPLPVPEPVAVFVEGRSRSRCTKKFLAQVPALAELRRRDPAKTKKLMLFTGDVQLNFVLQLRPPRRNSRKRAATT